jgi:DNA-binding CsgD family transcriptional regulator
MNRERFRRARDEIVRLARAGQDWVGFAAGAADAVGRVVSFDRTCWHTVDPGTVLFTGNVMRNIHCSGVWLAEHEYVLEDVNKWSFLAHSGRLAGATSLATHGDLTRSARHRSQAGYGIGDELRGSFVLDRVYWGAAAFLRDEGQPWFTDEEVRVLAALCEPIAAGIRHALVVSTAAAAARNQSDVGPGLVVFDENGVAESISPAAEHWVEQLVEIPRPATAADSKVLQAVAARVGAQDSLPARSRVLTRSGTWLLLYGTPLASAVDGQDGAPAGGRIRTAVIIQSAAPSDVAPLVALAYGLSERERQITRLCLQGLSTKQMAGRLQISPYTVQDHLKSIFDKTGVRSRGELVSQVFLDHYVSQWEPVPVGKPDWEASVVPPSADLGDSGLGNEP